jgi:PAS domain S-box-containing protein
MTTGIDALSLLENLPGAVFELATDAQLNLRYRFVSRRVAQVLGLSVETILADPLAPSSLVVPSHSARLFAAYEQSARERTAFSIDVPIHRPDGALCWIRTTATPRQGEDGLIWTGQWLDVTEETEVRERGADAERRLRDLTDSVPGALYQLRFTREGQVQLTYLSEGIAALVGVTIEEGQEDTNARFRVVLPEDMPAVIEGLRLAAETLQVMSVDFRVRHHKTGKIRWVRSVGRPRREPDGSTIINGFWQDLTDRKELEEELRQAHEDTRSAIARLRAIFDNTRIGLVMINKNLEFSDANPSLRELLLIEDEQEFAQDFPAFSPDYQPDGRPSMEKAREMILLAFEQGYNRFDWIHQTREGDPRPCEIALTCVEINDEPMIFATMTDLRERKQAEAALEAATVEARAASKAKSEFLANMSHEIRTPMNAIVGLTHLGLTSDEPDRLRDYLAKIDLAAKSLLQIINDILDFSKIEADKVQLENTRFDLYAVLDNLSSLVNLPAAEKSLELLFAIEPGLPSELIGDPLRLGQVLLNLTSNAIKFTERGQIVVRVSMISADSETARLCFEIIDTGIGITEEQSRRLFVPFSQADNSTTRRYGGTGLGLAICGRLVDLMDGEIDVESEPGVGSRFFFSALFGLPAKAINPVSAPASLRGMRVLVVDDNPTAVSILQVYLKSFGFHVDAVGSGEAALHQIQVSAHRPYQLVLMDWQMPGMDGVEATQRLRGLTRPEPLVIIMITAYGREEVERRAREAGCDGYLVKPVNPSLLLDSIMQAFGFEASIGVGLSLPEPQAEPLLAGRRVLLVEDNEINQQVALELLERAGAIADLAVNGAEAVRQIGEEHYDLVLMDMQMPVMDGLEATRLIRLLPGPVRSTPIVAMTANAMAEDRQRCLDAGMDDHIGKPVDVRKLHEVLARWTGRHAQPAEVPRAPDDIDFDEAIRRLADSRSLWERAAKRYLETPLAADSIGESIVAGERALARRIAHNLKGVAATLGLFGLSRFAGSVEHDLADGHTPLAGVAVAAQLQQLAVMEEAARDAIRHHLLQTPR